MGYHPRIECSKVASFQTTRARNSELWFVNNQELEEAILGYAARYSTRYEVTVYGLAIEGNHIHQVSLFPKANRAHYMRDFNSSVARAVARYQEKYPGGRFWARRYSGEHLASSADIEEYFFYTVLQPVNDGLVDDIRDYPGYNCFEDAITGRERKWKVVKWKEYHDARRWNKDICIEQFTEICVLKYTRLPGYERLSQAKYATLMRKKLRRRTKAALRKRSQSASMGAEKLKLVKPGTRPKTTKTSGPNDHRPRALSKFAESRKKANAWYFQTYFEYRAASKRYRAGELDVEFPKGTYKPPLFTVAFSGRIC